MSWRPQGQRSFSWKPAAWYGFVFLIERVQSRDAVGATPIPVDAGSR